MKIKPYEEDDTQGWTGGPGMYQRITDLRKNNTKLKIMLSIGGWVSIFVKLNQNFILSEHVLQTHASKGFNEVVRDDASM